MLIETRLQSLAWDKSGGNLFTAQAVAGIKGGVSLDQALARNVGNLDSDAKGELQVDDPRGGEYRCGVSGADQPVRAMKPGNAGRAKGLNCPALTVSQPAMGGAHG